MEVEVRLFGEDNLTIIAFESRCFLLHFVIRRHVAEKVAVLSEFQATKLTGVNVFRFVVFCFYSRWSCYADPWASSGELFIHNWAEDFAGESLNHNF